ncbi:MULTISPECIES: RICIN domain-containing protein [Streptomyces]|uniref:RICIN domain-containing protein n=1 Tax=Streptomyces TaxID=1883 RepID=UPI000A07DF2A|nr:RICIN domain-containing protein [Streptomyces sp. MOE7]ARH93948.1 hypothetical protein STRMOE7_30770 [Streptomyces sp. MOE7]
MLLSLALTGLGVAASPFVAGTAHAEALPWLRDEGSSDHGNAIYAQPGDAAGEWSFRVNEADGSFHILTDGTGKCVDSEPHDALFMDELWDCSGADTQKLYAHTDGDQLNSNFRIRNVSNDECLDADGWGALSSESVRIPAEIYGCHNGGTGQAGYPAAT